jgi:hypothetical protein
MFVMPPNDGKVIVLARVEDDPDPDFALAAKTRCMNCRKWCWLGDETLALVSAGNAAPLCLICMQELGPGAFLVDQVTDSPRKDQS